jgi:hypothetical protein
MIQKILNKFPKKRPVLDPRIKKLYQAEYLKNRDGKSTFQSWANKLEAWMHIKAASISAKKILELGAGTLNHIPYESGFEIYDIVEPFKQLFTGRKDLKNINSIYSDIIQINKKTKYDKIVSIATLEHVEDLPKLLAKSCLLMKKNGIFQAGIPSEGGFLWGLTWRTTTGIEFYLRTKLNYKNLMRHEHINSAKEIELLCRWFFKNVKVNYFPINCFHLSWYIYLECKNPILNRAKEILK